MIPLLLICAFFWVTRDSWGAMLKSAATSKGKGHNEVGWWGREIGHLFPSFRSEWGRGWRDHKAVVTQKQADAAGQKARQQPGYRQLRQQIADHKRQMRAASQQPQPAPTGGRRHSQPPASQPATSQPASGQPHGAPLNPTQPANGHDPMTCKDPNCSCHTGSGQASAPAPPTGGAGSTNGTSGGTVTTPSGSGGTGDIDYEGAHQTIAQIIQDAEHAVSPATIRDAGTLADGLPAMIPDDAQTFGHVADSVSCLRQAAAKAAEAREHAEAAKTTLTKNFGAQHEAVQSSGHDAERGFHGVG